MEESLIGNVYGWSPRFKGLESFAMGRWKKFALVSVHLIKDNVFLFNFENEEGKMRVLEGGPYTFDRRPSVLLPWKPRLRIDLESIQKLPIWIQLLGLPWEF